MEVLMIAQRRHRGFPSATWHDIGSPGACFPTFERTYCLHFRLDWRLPNLVKTKTVCSSETSVTTYQATQRHIAEDHSPRQPMSNTPYAVCTAPTVIRYVFPTNHKLYTSFAWQPYHTLHQQYLNKAAYFSQDLRPNITQTLNGLPPVSLSPFRFADPPCSCYCLQEIIKVRKYGVLKGRILYDVPWKPSRDEGRVHANRTKQTRTHARFTRLQEDGYAKHLRYVSHHLRKLGTTCV